MGVHLMPGQLITSQPHLVKETGLTRQNIRTALKKIEKTGEITTKATNQFTIVTVVNWGKYQIDDNNANQQKGNQMANN